VFIFHRELILIKDAEYFSVKTEADSKRKQLYAAKFVLNA